jgi:two-component system OmpR family sensor kinase
MFRSVRGRLIALYVIAAVALVVVVGASVTALSVWASARNADETVKSAARNAPEIARLYRRDRSLESAAPSIARALARPGLRIMVVGIDPDGDHRLLATVGPGSDRAIAISRPPMIGPAPVAPLGGSRSGGGPGGGGPGRPPGGGNEPWNAGGPPPGLPPFAAMMRPHVQRAAIPGGEIVVLFDPRLLIDAAAAIGFAFVPIGLIAVLAAFLFGRYIANQALQPLVATTAALQRFAEGDLTPRAVPVAERGEFNELVVAYNGAVAEVGRAFEERRAAELQMRQFIADAGHELRTPLTVITGFIEVLWRRLGGAENGMSPRIYDTMRLESRRMQALIDKLIELARLENVEAADEQSVDIAQLCTQICATLETVYPGRPLELRVEARPVVVGSVSELREAIANLVENALKYAAPSPVGVRIAQRPGYAVLEVSDRGPGIASGEQQRIFDRFYRGESRGETQGFGLGLAIAKRAVERAGGKLGLESKLGEGSTFRIELPNVQTRPKSSDAERVPV